jgi:acyl-CoA synthetase (AMP-forming)/AMP-acid ligase II
MTEATGTNTLAESAEAALRRSRMQTLGEITARNARRYPDRAALAFEGATLTFAELDRRVNRLAAALTRRGVSHGANVAILMYNCLEFVEAFLACHKLGACAVPINFRLAAAEVQFQLVNAQAVGVIVDANLDSLARQARTSSSTFILSLQPECPPDDNYDRALAAERPDPPQVEVSEQDLAFLMYTSGTTGQPKGAMLSHANLVANTVNWLLEVGARQDDVWLSGLPLFHIGGINGILPFLYLGATAVVTPSTGFDPVDSLRQLAEHRATICYFVPTQWQQICSTAEVARIDTSRLRLALWGASQAPAATLKLMSDTFPEVGIINAFGQTEMSSNTCFLLPADAINKMGSVGRPAVNVEARIVDGQMNDVPAGEIGEIVYRGPTVMQGYYGNPAETEKAFAGGWFHSGDLVRQDVEGFLTVVDRKKDMIISGGENIYPAEVEKVLEAHPDIAEVAVIGLPHPKWVESPVACVVCKNQQLSPEEVIAFTRDRLASYKKPTAVLFFESLPRNASGKVLKHVLRQRAADQLAERTS